MNLKLLYSIQSFLLFFLMSLCSYAQEWTFMGGTSLTSQFSVYGTQGVAAPSNMPGARNSAAYWKDNNGKFWFFGGSGYTASSGSAVGNSDLWKYDPITNLWTWVKGPTVSDQQGIYGTQGTPAPANTPGGREWAASWTDNAGNLWLYGGYGADISTGGILNDLWKFDIATSEWTWVHGSSTAGAAAVYGTQGVAAPANTPGRRFNATYWKDNNGDLWIFGGANSLVASMNDLWKYNIALNQWTWMGGSTTTNQAGVYGTQGVPSAANMPGARQSGITWVDNAGNLWLYGGAGYAATGTGYMNDLWKYDPVSGQWTWMKGSNGVGITGVYGTLGAPAAGNTPGSRWQGVSFKDNAGNLFLYAGEGYAATATPGRLNDVWKYNIVSNEWTWIKGANTVGQAGVYGTLGVMAPANTPAAKWAMTAWTDNAGALWTFGGNLSSNGHMNDLWKFVPCTVLPPDPLNSTPAVNKIICIGKTTTLSATSNNHQVNWFASATSTPVLASGTNFTTNPLPAGSYTFFAEGNGCQTSTGRTAIAFTVNPWPSIAVNSGAICQGKTFTLIPTGAATYTYSSGSNTVSPSTTSTYTITGKDAAGCTASNTAFATVTVHALPLISVNSGSICRGQSFVLQPNGATTYTYSGGLATVSPTITTNYSVTGTDANNCISASAAVATVIVHAQPTLNATSSATLICAGESVMLLAIGADSYSWSPGGTGSSIVVSPAATTTYILTGTNTSGCSSTFNLTQQVDQCAGINAAADKKDKLRLYPNPGEGLFNLVITGKTTVRVSNALGEVIFENTLEEGTYKVDLSAHAQGIYFFSLEQNGSQRTLKAVKH